MKKKMPAIDSLKSQMEETVRIRDLGLPLKVVFDLRFRFRQWEVESAKDKATKDIQAFIYSGMFNSEFGSRILPEPNQYPK